MEQFQNSKPVMTAAEILEAVYNQGAHNHGGVHEDPRLDEDEAIAGIKRAVEEIIGEAGVNDDLLTTKDLFGDDPRNTIGESEREMVRTANRAIVKVKIKQRQRLALWLGESEEQDD